jgi:membrane protein
MPDIDLEWRDVVLGGLTTSILFNSGKLVVGYYLGKTNLASTYGAAGSLVVCLFWVYYSALVFFFGAEFTQVFANRYGSAPTLRVRRLLLGTLRPMAADVAEPGK